MMCPHCKRALTYVDVLSQCYQRGLLEEKDGQYYITEYNRLDILDTDAIRCPHCQGPLMHLVGEDATTHVDLLSSGYEWTCPACKHLNTVSAASTTESVRCAECKIGFTVNTIHHCNGE